MNNLKYMPVFRLRQQEQLVLEAFDFGKRIFPCLEIIKEHDRERKNNQKSFEEILIPLLKKINSVKIFIDLPVHIRETRAMKKPTLNFFRKVISNRRIRTDYILKLNNLSDKIIPIISSYFPRTGEQNSILLQESDLRKHFKSLAFRTLTSNFKNDISQIEKIATKDDHLIVDFEDNTLEMEEDEEAYLKIQERLNTFKKCPIIILRSAISDELTNVSLDHGKKITSVNNNHIYQFTDFSGSCFADYAGIKKDKITEGGGISPGFIYYDAIRNHFYGYKGKVKRLVEFETTIVPDVIASPATKRMSVAGDFLDSRNFGWSIILGINSGKEKGKSMAKFKRIAMEHYLHCIRTKINKGDFDS
jgi:hypothetical protein